MARIKPTVAEANEENEGYISSDEDNAHISAAAGDDQESPESSAEQDDSGYVSEEAEDLSGVDPDSLYNEGKAALYHSQFDAAIEMFEVAVRAQAFRLGDDDLHPDLAKYWFSYGDSLFTKLENDESLLALDNTQAEADDEKGLAWTLLDTARVCYEKKLEQFEGESNIARLNFIPNMLEWLKSSGSDIAWNFVTTEESNIAALDAVKGLMDTRVRLGDFKLAFHEYEDAGKEYLEALKIGVTFGLPPAIVLVPLVPLCYCFVGAGSDAAEFVYRAATSVVNLELADEVSPSRRALLESTIRDLQIQLDEYTKVKGSIKEKIMEAVEHVQGDHPDDSAMLNISEETDTPVLDLGVIRNSKRALQDETEQKKRRNSE